MLAEASAESIQLREELELKLLHLYKTFSQFSEQKQTFLHDSISFYRQEEKLPFIRSFSSVNIREERVKINTVRFNLLLYVCFIL